MDFMNFFSDLDFDFDNDLKSENSIAKNFELPVYSYKNPNQTNILFYLVATNLSEEQCEKVRRYIWNENDADIIFLHRNDELQILYAKCNPKIINIEDCKIDSFSTTEKNNKELEKIKRWQFDSGAFWLNYSEFLNKAKKYNKIDKDLVTTLVELKNQLNSKLTDLISEETERNKIVQALIDRTLYIKYLEDNHIINSFFYKHYFNDDSLDYRQLLNAGNEDDINRLFNIIHKIFNNKLFDDPKISNEYLTPDICNLIAMSFNVELKDKQLRLFDFQFNVLPIEFISYIYEVFLTEEQKANGIYYTPKKLAQLIVDDVINEDKIGSILDPACGSGMFLIVGFQRLLEIAKKQNLEPQNNIDKIKFRTELLKDNIFGIEKQPIAQRLTLFSLSLQIFDGIPSSEIKQFIAQELEKHNEINLFSEYNFYENILCHNTLDIENLPFKDKKIDYIVGNPPFFEIKQTNEEISFLKNYKINDTFVRDIVGTNQISQCFLLKIKDWCNENTRLGFVSNSSSFYNDKSSDFQKYFYANYGIEKIYELSKVKKILFEKAKESVAVVIFNNQFTDNNIEYYSVEMGLFSEKPFELLIIQEDKAIPIEQDKLAQQELKLRDYLVGNEFDRLLISKISQNVQLKKFSYPIKRGFEIWGEAARKKEFNLSKKDWKKLDDKQKAKYLDRFIGKYFSSTFSSYFNKPYIKPVNIKSFRKLTSDKFICDIDNFHRPRKDKNIYSGKKLIFSRLGSNLNCVYSQDIDYFDFSIYTFKLKDENLYFLFQALLNSQIIRFYIDVFQRKRISDSYSRIGNDDILNIPVPKDLDEDLVSQISKMSKDLTDGVSEYSEKEAELNELIFDLYDLSYIERQRVKDYFLKEQRVNKSDLKLYEETLKDSMEMFFKNPIQIETYRGFNLIVSKIILNKNYFSDNNPTTKKTFLYTLNEVFEQNYKDNYLTGQEKIFGEHCVYIIKKDINKNWTETKAYEDKQEILKHLIS